MQKSRSVIRVFCFNDFHEDISDENAQLKTQSSFGFALQSLNSCNYMWKLSPLKGDSQQCSTSHNIFDERVFFLKWKHTKVMLMELMNRNFRKIIKVPRLEQKLNFNETIILSKITKHITLSMMLHSTKIMIHIISI